MYCTDLPEVVPLIEINRDINQNMITGTFVGKSLKWYVWYFYCGDVPHAIYNLLPVFAIHYERLLQKLFLIIKHILTQCVIKTTSYATAKQAWNQSNDTLQSSPPSFCHLKCNPMCYAAPQ